MKLTHLFILVLPLLFAISCNNADEDIILVEENTEVDYSDLDEQARQLFGSLELTAESPDNPFSVEKVKLGQKLYFDKRLSLDNRQSCNTCHNLATYGVDNEPTSKGNNGGRGDRNSPTTLNAAFHFVQFWDGREPHVEAQAGGPVLNPVEMEMPSEAAVIERLFADAKYQEMFNAAFPDKSNPITYDNMKKAIGAFERELVTQSPFDAYMDGDDNALSSKEKRGMKTFIETGCVQCHTGPLLGGNQFQKFGVFGNYWDETKSKKIDEGRFAVTGDENHKYQFKVPSLRNIDKTYPYFHDGSVKDLSEVIRIMGKVQLNKSLTDSDIDDMIAFLKTLTGDIPDHFKQEN